MITLVLYSGMTAGIIEQVYMIHSDNEVTSQHPIALPLDYESTLYCHNITMQVQCHVDYSHSG